MPACGRLVAMDKDILDALIEEFGDIEAWRPEASMPECHVGWLHGLAGCLAWLAAWPVPAAWLGWLARLAGLAGWLQLAGCCWLPAAMKEVSQARWSRRSADIRIMYP